MKKWILLTLMLLALAVPALAGGLPLVVDDAALLSQDSMEQLSDEAQRLSSTYAMDVVILTTKSLDGKTALNYAADYYESKGYGQGEAHDGVMLVLSTEDRDWCILTTGRAIDAFTDDGIGAISDDIVSYFSKGDYSGGFSRFLSDARVYLRTPLERTVGIALYLAIAAAVIAAVVLLVMVLGMKTARPQYNASQYVKDKSLDIMRSQDIYLYHTQTRVRVEKESSSGGGSSTFSSSSGSSHGGSSGKF